MIDEHLIGIKKHIGTSNIFSMTLYSTTYSEYTNILASVLKFGSAFIVSINDKSEIVDSFDKVIEMIKHIMPNYITVYGPISKHLTDWHIGIHHSYDYKATLELP